MTRPRNLTAAIFLFASHLLGGSVQGIWGVLLLQIAAVGLVLAAINSKAARPLTPWARRLCWIAALSVALLLIHIVPLPPALWSALPGRQSVSEGLAMLGQRVGWMSWSLAPYSTIAAGLALLCPVAMFLSVARRPDTSRRLLVAALLAATFAGCLLGVLQLVGGGHQYYLYRFSAFGSSTGFFANSNHMGTLLLVSAPFLVALASEGGDSRRDPQARGMVRVAAAAGGLLLIASILLNGSLAVQLLGLPVALGCLAMVGWGRAPGQRRWLGIAALVAICAIGLLLFVAHDRFGATNNESFATRADIWSTSLAALREVSFAGSGIGTFAEYYRGFEDAAAVTPTFVNHAHNDYLELLVEGGAAAAILLLLFLAWWTVVAVRVWRGAKFDIYSRAASVASAAILLHSLVDYPLRTTALATLFAMSLALMCVKPSITVGGERSDLRPTRHRRLR